MSKIDNWPLLPLYQAGPAQQFSLTWPRFAVPCPRGREAARAHKRPSVQECAMFVATSRLQIEAQNEEIFTTRWLNREVYIRSTPGLVRFQLLRGTARDGCVLYMAHTQWESREDFLAWTQSEAFRAIFLQAGGTHAATPPFFEGLKPFKTSRIAARGRFRPSPCHIH